MKLYKKVTSMYAPLDDQGRITGMDPIESCHFEEATDAELAAAHSRMQMRLYTDQSAGPVQGATVDSGPHTPPKGWGVTSEEREHIMSSPPIRPMEEVVYKPLVLRVAERLGIPTGGKDIDAQQVIRALDDLKLELKVKNQACAIMKEELKAAEHSAQFMANQFSQIQVPGASLDSFIRDISAKAVDRVKALEKQLGLLQHFSTELQKEYKLATDELDASVKRIKELERNEADMQHEVSSLEVERDKAAVRIRELEKQLDDKAIGQTGVYFNLRTELQKVLDEYQCDTDMELIDEVKGCQMDRTQAVSELINIRRFLSLSDYAATELTFAAVKEAIDRKNKQIEEERADRELFSTSVRNSLDDAKAALAIGFAELNHDVPTEKPLGKQVQNMTELFCKKVEQYKALRESLQSILGFNNTRTDTRYLEEVGRTKSDLQKSHTELCAAHKLIADACTAAGVTKTAELVATIQSLRRLVADACTATGVAKTEELVKAIQSLQHISTAHEELQTRYLELGVRVSAMAETLRTIQDGSLREHYDRLSTKYTELQHEYKRLSLELDALKKQYDYVKQALDMAHNHLATLRSAVRSLVND